MALERNNTALQFEPGFDAEFERMLQRHLKHGGAPVAACLGFDADAASAFLENALNASARSRYESHLAGCPACRRHVIELSRLEQLMRLVPQLETAPQSAKVAQPVWAKWKTAVAGWFDFSEWRWNWQTAGLAGAAMAVLVAAVAIRPWNRPSNREVYSEAVANAPGSTTASPAGTVFSAASPTPEILADSSAPQPAEANAQTALVNRERSDAPAAVVASIPAPDAGVKPSEETLASNLPLRTPNDLRDGIPFQFSAGAPSTPVSRSLPSSPYSSSASLTRNVAVQESPVAAPKPVEPPPGENKEASEKEVADAPNRLGPSSEDNPMRSDPAKPSENARKQESDKSRTKAGWIDRVMAFAPTRKTDRNDKPAPVIRNEEENRFLIVRIHNRVFRFENGAWVDNEYKGELMEWRVTRLVRGSDEFNRVLADQPQLKPYFDKTPILVIWRDKIYKVVAK